jgi:hypothetical protein
MPSDFLCPLWQPLFVLLLAPAMAASSASAATAAAGSSLCASLGADLLCWPNYHFHLQHAAHQPSAILFSSCSA